MQRVNSRSLTLFALALELKFVGNQFSQLRMSVER
jgi:hypothetical protein